MKMNNETEKILEEMDQKVDRARSLVAVIWEENKVATKEPEAIKRAAQVKEENTSPLLRCLRDTNYQLDQLLIDLRSLRDSLDL